MDNETKSIISDLPENGIIITITAIGCYLIGYFYVLGFFGRLGIPQSILDLQFSSYLTQGSLAIIISFGICFIFIFFNDFPIKNRITCSLANTPLLIGTIVFFAAYRLLPPTSQTEFIGIFLIILGLTFVILYIITIYKEFYFFKFQNWNFMKKIVVLLFILVLLAFLSFIYGYSFGTNQIEGGKTAAFIQIYTFNNTMNLNGKDMIYITHQNNKYFVTNLEKPAPLYPIIYVIEDSQVEIVKFEQPN
jgi:hypothetical protein